MDTPATIYRLPFDLDLTADEDEDTRAITEKLMTGKPLDPAVYRRIRERADRISDEVFRQHGLLNIGVPAIRSLRDGDDK